MDIAEALLYGRQTLADSSTPDIDSQILLCHTLSCSTGYLHTWPDRELTRIELDTYKRLLRQREAGSPVAYITGQRGFWSLDLRVTSDTLIPRTDTELLVELALARIQAGMKVADLGTGTGAVALALAKENPQTHFLAMDYSWAALEIAQQNAKQNHIYNVHFWQGDWLTAVKGNSMDLIVSNPPYIASHDPHLEQGDVRFEPVSALVSGKDGLDDIRKIIAQAIHSLVPGGWIMIEHGYQQAAIIMQLFQQAGFEHISSYQDFGGNDRVVTAQLPL